MSGPLLETRGLTVTFGGLNANDDIDLDVGAGAFVGLIGPNGAGKTTLVDAVTGFVTPASGRIALDGTRVDALPPHRRAAAGMARTFQQLELFEDLSVYDNLRAAGGTARWRDLLADLIVPARGMGPDDDVDWALETLGLTDIAHARPGEISHGRRKLVGVARALASRPRILLLDEPAAGLDTTESARLGAQLRSLPEHGVTVLLIDHDMGLVLDVCDEITVLDFGAVIARGTPGEIRRDPQVIAAYLGSGSAS